jgi:hypothetical protein
MSLTSFLANIWAGIKNVFDGLEGDLKDAVSIGVVVTDNLKNFVDSPAADVLTAIIPGDLDDDIKDWLRKALPNIVTELKLVDSTLGLTDPNAITAAAIKVLQGLDGDIKSAFLHNLSILIAQVAANGKLTWSDAVYILQWYYEHEYQPATT